MSPPIPVIEPAREHTAAVLPTMQTETRAHGAAPTGLLSGIMRRWWLIGLTTAAGLVVGLIYFSSAAKTYSANVVIGTSHIASSSDTSDSFFAAQRALIQSPALLDQCGASTERLRVSSSDADGTITIHYEAPSSAQAARLANAIALTYVRKHESARSPRADELAALVKQRDQSAAQRDAAARALNDFQISIDSFQQADHAAAARLAQLKSTLATAQAELKDASAESNAAPAAIEDKKKLAELIIAHRGTGIFDALDLQRDRVNNQIDALTPILAQQRKTLLPQHPVLQASEAKMRQLRSQLAALDAQYGPAYQHWLDQQRVSADEKVQAIAQMVAQQEASSKDAAGRAQKNSALVAKLKAADTQLAEMDQKLRDQNLSNAAAPPAVKIILPAEAPRNPTRPDRSFVLMICAAGGLVLGLLIAAMIPASTRRRV